MLVLDNSCAIYNGNFVMLPAYASKTDILLICVNNDTYYTPSMLF